MPHIRKTIIHNKSQLLSNDEIMNMKVNNTILTKYDYKIIRYTFLRLTA